MNIDVKHLQAVCDLTREYLNLKQPLIIEVKDVHRGRARTKTGKITIPLWACEKDEGYAIYYAVHETVHFHKDTWGHCALFKRLEQGICKEFGVTFTYRKAYPKRLYYNGELVHERI